MSTGMGAYADAALSVHAAGLNPLPITDGKVPAVKWRKWQGTAMKRGLVSKWSTKFGDANIGATTGGVSGVLVVDVDTTDEAVWAECIRRYGDTPLRACTATGKLHLYYRSPGGVRNAQRVDGMPVDLRGDGGFIVLPPSTRSGTAYTWLQGDLSALPRLPLPRDGAIAVPSVHAAVTRPSGMPRRASGTVGKGERNTALFDHLRSVGAECASEADLRHVAETWNAGLAVPLGSNEVARTVHSVWQYVERGSLMVPGGESVVAVPRRVLDQLAAREHRALALYMLLKARYDGRREEFTVPIRQMAPDLEWAEATLRKARSKLIEAGVLIEVHRGGAHDHDASRFRFA